jgi:hypothetical protein
MTYMENILYSLKQISEFLTHSDEQHDIEKWWNVFSQAFDRLFLLFFYSDVNKLNSFLVNLFNKFHEENSFT